MYGVTVFWHYMHSALSDRKMEVCIMFGMSVEFNGEVNYLSDEFS